MILSNILYFSKPLFSILQVGDLVSFKIPYLGFLSVSVAWMELTVSSVMFCEGSRQSVGLLPRKSGQVSQW